MKTALYRHFSANHQLLYVGISISPLTRTKQHRAAKWFDDIGRIDIEYFKNRELAIEAEKTVIQSEKPKHNVQHVKKARRKRLKRDERNKRICAEHPRITFDDSLCPFSLTPYIKAMIERNVSQAERKAKRTEAETAA